MIARLLHHMALSENHPKLSSYSITSPLYGTVWTSSKESVNFGGCSWFRCVRQCERWIPLPGKGRGPKFTLDKIFGPAFHCCLWVEFLNSESNASGLGSGHARSARLHTPDEHNSFGPSLQKSRTRDLRQVAWFFGKKIALAGIETTLPCQSTAVPLELIGKQI